MASGTAGARHRYTTLIVSVALLAVAVPAGAEAPFPTPPEGQAQDYPSYAFLGSGDCSQGNASDNDLPPTFDCEGDWKYTDHRDTSDELVRDNPQEFYGVKGTGVNTGWEVTTGRPDVLIAVLDSGIRWEEDRPGLLRKHFLNRHELPLPQREHATASPPEDRFGGYDVNGDGMFNVEDYHGDPRVRDLNGNGVVDPEDLIRLFSDGVDDDGNGYVDDISGWDFFEDDNNPQDDVDYGHGTGEANDSGGEAGFEDGQCPNCMVMSLRVGDSFIADANHFAEAVVYGVDNGVSVIQEALGTLNHTSYGQAAVDHAYRNGVIVNASMADEAAGHHNWPAAYDHTMGVNSIRTASLPTTRPQSYVYFNGCTNFGGYTYVSIPSTACSSEATGRSAGVSGLLYSAARNAIERGSMTPYLRDDGTPAGFALSAEEAMQLWRLSADDIDFASACPEHDFCDDAPDGTSPRAAADDYATSTPATERYRTVKGWDYFTGYGRSNAARLLHFIGVEGQSGTDDREWIGDGPYGFGSSPLTAQDRIPPEADLTWPRFWGQYAVRDDGTLVLPDDPSDPASIVVSGRVAANRVTSAGGSFDWVLEYAPQVQGPAGTAPVDGSEESSGGPWIEIASDTGLREAFVGELGRVAARDVRAAVAASTAAFTPADDPTSEFQPEQHAIRLRLRVIAHPTDPADTVNNEAVHQKQIDVYPAGEDILRDDIGVPFDPATAMGVADIDRLNTDALGRYAGGEPSPSYHDLDGDGDDELLLATSDGVIHAYTDVATGEELPGWPVLTDPVPSVQRHVVGDGVTPVDNAYTRGEVTDEVYGAPLLGSVAAVDLDDDGTLEVTVADMEGKVYVFEVDGSRREGFPVTTDPALSQEPSCEGRGIVTGGDGACDDYAGPTGTGLRDRFNARDHGINGQPAIGDLDPTTPGLEIVVGANDAHVYAWHADGTPVEGWPVVLRDPDTVATMDPATRVWTYADGSNPAIGTKVLVSPALGDIDGDGDLEVVIGVNEEYVEITNTDPLDEPVVSAAGPALGSGNTRLYALHHTGAATPAGPETEVTPHTHDQAYAGGWPAKMALLVTDLLPYVAAGTNTQAILFDADDDGTLEIATASAAGPAYVFDHDGTSFYGRGATGRDRTLATTVPGASSGPLTALEAAARTIVPAVVAIAGSGSRGALIGVATQLLAAGARLNQDLPTFVAVGGLAVGSLDGGLTLSVAGPGAGLKRLLDILLEARQLGASDHVNLWDVTTGEMRPDAPVVVNDLQFFNSPMIADVDGDGFAETVQGTAVSDLALIGSFPTPGVTRHHTGGWTVSAATIGATVADGAMRVTTVTREGYLRLFPTPIAAGTDAACTAVQEWPEYGHDASNSGNRQVDAERPSPVTDLAATVDRGTATLRFTATGDDRRCGGAVRYEVRRAPGHGDAGWRTASPVATLETGLTAGDDVALDVALPKGAQTLLLRAFDDAGNGSSVARIRIHITP